jgi:hypothetical protein
MRFRVGMGSLAALTTILACVPARAVLIFNSSFEQPVLVAPLAILNDPTAADQGAGANDRPWLFTGSAGVAHGNTTVLGLTIPAAIDGNQVGFLDQGGAFSQVLSFPVTGQYTLNYQEAGNGIYTVFIDANVIIPSHLSSTAFSPMSASFNVTAGDHTLAFQDTDPRQVAGPTDAFIDSVSVVPEPAASALLLMSVSFLLRRRSRLSTNGRQSGNPD